MQVIFQIIELISAAGASFGFGVLSIGLIWCCCGIRKYKKNNPRRHEVFAMNHLGRSASTLASTDTTNVDYLNSRSVPRRGSTSEDSTCCADSDCCKSKCCKQGILQNSFTYLSCSDFSVQLLKTVQLHLLLYQSLFTISLLTNFF